MARARLLLALLCLPVLTVVWLGWRIASMDADVRKQQVRETQEMAATQAVESLREFSARVRAGLVGAGIEIDLRGNGVFASIDRDGFAQSKGAPLVFHPFDSPAGGDDEFESGESLEFRENRPLDAARAFRVLASRPEPSIRAGALIRLGRNLVKAGRMREAEEVYRKLRELADTNVGGLPAEAAAIQAAALMYERAGRPERLAAEAESLSSGMRLGKWRLSKVSYEYLDNEVKRWRSTPASDPATEAYAAAVDHVWRAGSPEGAAVIHHRGVPVTAFWRTSEGRRNAAIFHPSLIASVGLPESPGLQFALTDTAGLLVLGNALPGAASRDPSVTGLPWGLQAAVVAAPSAALSPQTQLLITALALMIVTVAVGAVFSLRAMRAEIATSQREAEFVSAVSHELRSPLTSLRSMSELLTKGRVAADRRERFYESMVWETRRLQRTVEDLLRFGKLSAAGTEIPMEPLDLEGLLREAVKRRGAGARVVVEADPDLPLVHGDAPALLTVFDNVLDNALKYSPSDSQVSARAVRNGNNLEVCIRDTGCGIDPAEHQAIFERFYRSSTARSGTVPGTGLGLPLAALIVKAHRGSIRVESVPEHGSAFTITLPVAG